MAQLNLSLYGTREAANNLADTFTKLLAELGFEVGKCSRCRFAHYKRDLAMTVHGDDFTFIGPGSSSSG